MIQETSSETSSSEHGYRKNWDPRTNYKDETVAKQYDAVRFNSLAGRAYVRLERRILLKAFSSLPRDARIADIPCGTGRLAEVLLEAGYQVEGMDISREMLDVAKMRLARFGQRFRTEVVDAMAIANPAARFDGALCARVLMHFPLDEQVAFLQGVARLTDGPVVFTQSFDSGYQRFRRRIKSMLRHQKPAAYPLSKADLATLLGRAGLKEVHRYRVLSPLSEAMMVVAWKP